MVNTKKKQKPVSLSHGRPPAARKPKASLSSKATRNLIQSHHRLHKALADATRQGDEQTASAIRQQIEDRGGLKSYQQASIQGQSSDRGGDTSRILLDWLPKDLPKGRTIRMLEVGALSVNNACSKSDIFDVTRIDLNSQAVGIEQQDFMERPIPETNADKFDIISLSLVLNYVPEALGRGEMLRRTCQFLRALPVLGFGDSAPGYFPSLFLVLPAPCVINSRYLDETLLNQIMVTLGYSMVKKKLSTKLIYYLWRYQGKGSEQRHRFRKDEVNPGKTRNNFCIILD
ncbi:nucleolus protein, partial [Aureobasidium melanogenum]